MSEAEDSELEGNSPASGPDEEDIAPECAATSAPKGVAPVACSLKDDLPTLEGLGAGAGYPTQGMPMCPVSSSSTTMQMQMMEEDRPSSQPFSSMGTVTTPIAPGPSRWLLQALKVAQQAAVTV